MKIVYLRKSELQDSQISTNRKKDRKNKREISQLGDSLKYLAANGANIVFVYES